jgi:hypothetical protein
MATPALPPMIVHAVRLPEELLVRAGLENERLVMLESTDAGELVRKLTVAEKVEHTKRTGESAFFAGDQEFDEAVRSVGSVLPSSSSDAWQSPTYKSGPG